MKRLRSNFYKRIRCFCELRVGDVSRATGITEFAITQIEKGRREPNHVEAKLIESFLRARVRIVFEMYGPMPDWVREQEREPAAKLLEERT